MNRKKKNTIVPCRHRKKVIHFPFGDLLIEFEHDPFEKLRRGAGPYMRKKSKIYNGKHRKKRSYKSLMVNRW